MSLFGSSGSDKKDQSSGGYFGSNDSKKNSGDDMMSNFDHLADSMKSKLNKDNKKNNKSR